MHLSHHRCHPQSLHLLRSGRSGALLRALALCIVAVTAIGFVARAVDAATDQSWPCTTPTNISRSDTKETLHPAIAAHASLPMAAVWSDLPPGLSTDESLPDIYVARSDDRGSSWSAPAPVSPASGRTQQLPDALVAESRIFVAWAEQDKKTFTVHEAELGGLPRLIPIPSADSPSRITTGPRLAAGPDRLHVVFNAGHPSSHIFHSSRALDDPSWPTATRIYTSTRRNPSWFPALAVSPDGSDLHVVWEEKPFRADRSVWYVRGTADGANSSWSSPLRLSGEVNSVKPDVGVTVSGDVHVVWAEADSENDLYHVAYRSYDDDARTWTPAQHIHDQPFGVNQISPNEAAPRLALWEQGQQVRLCAVWHGFRIDGGEVAGSAAEVGWLSCSHDGGATWQPPRSIASFSEGQAESANPSIRPSIVFDVSGSVHAVWQQRVDADGDGAFEIYYARDRHHVFLPLVFGNL